MKDKELLNHLNNLSEIKPSASWRESNEKLLLSQINASAPNCANENIFRLYFRIFTSFSQPAMVVFLLLFIIGGVGVGLGVGQNSKPGDSLYIAKIVNEKARFTFTFDEKKKVQLGIEFAKNRVKEIEEVKAGDNNEGVDELLTNFERDIVVVRERIEKIYTPEVVNEDIESLELESPVIAKVESVNNKEENVEENEGDKSEEEVVIVHSANADKDENGITVSTGVIEEEKIELEESVKQVEVENINVAPEDMLVEIEEMVKNDDFESALKRLEEVVVVINEDDSSVNLENVDEDIVIVEATSTEEIEVESEILEKSPYAEATEDRASTSEEVK